MLVFDLILFSLWKASFIAQRKKNCTWMAIFRLASQFLIEKSLNGRIHTSWAENIEKQEAKIILWWSVNTKVRAAAFVYLFICIFCLFLFSSFFFFFKEKNGILNTLALCTLEIQSEFLCKYIKNRSRLAISLLSFALNLRTYVFACGYSFSIAASCIHVFVMITTSH